MKEDDTKKERITSIIIDKKQTRTAIPQTFADKLNISKLDKINWKLRGKKLTGTLKQIEAEENIKDIIGRQKLRDVAKNVEEILNG